MARNKAKNKKKNGKAKDKDEEEEKPTTVLFAEKDVVGYLKDECGYKEKLHKAIVEDDGCLDGQIAWIIDLAVKRAKANKRKVLKETDFPPSEFLFGSALFHKENVEKRIGKKLKFPKDAQDALNSAIVAELDIGIMRMKANRRKKLLPADLYP